ncbi:hypothetical protein N658DRAFT_177557 [Parathielavia hyrcaniae]|uniref:Uncharacterized protein n=1 Tax=Parathielavia hyrcaniae TaxID=113614 RepID=A0AAN6Q6H1_9PEZI|nr:hypothetical protein N658DRAFT_177557 [Parathielavia hyrcaniae]
MISHRIQLISQRSLSEPRGSRDQGVLRNTGSPWKLGPGGQREDQQLINSQRNCRSVEQPQFDRFYSALLVARSLQDTAGSNTAFQRNLAARGVKAHHDELLCHCLHHHDRGIFSARLYSGTIQHTPFTYFLAVFLIWTADRWESAESIYMRLRSIGSWTWAQLQQRVAGADTRHGGSSQDGSNGGDTGRNV